MHITAEVREKWRKKIEDDPYGEVRASAVKLLLKDIDELRAALTAARPYVWNGDSPGGCDGNTIDCEHCAVIRDIDAALGDLG